MFGKTAENFLGSSTHQFIYNNPSIFPPLIFKNLPRLLFSSCVLEPSDLSYQCGTVVTNRLDNDPITTDTPLIAPSTVMTVVASSSGAPPPAMFGPPYTDTAASTAMQPIASNSNAPPPSSPTTPAVLGPPRADLCSSKNSHYRSTTTSNPIVHHKQEEGSSLALQRHMKA
ncbi:PREDICTED: uncharacterized protein LOC105112962 [Populus euphratica]|uniref:Uncharacterized protein LOC105112962 n=1 Tax=Populus euphratica TaxID=75702 RepID=A0AAJ6T9U5_POPEU|nr:PREDICTED: uncharacterized protein LOC105112962 [Populus euphratica]